MHNRQKLLDTGYFVCNEYFEKYVCLIDQNAHTGCIPCKTNKHHIVPRHYFTERNMPVDNSDDNVINLYYKDHVLAHILLAGCTEARDKYNNLCAVFYMSGQKYFEKIEDYQNLIETYQDIYVSALSFAQNPRKGSKCSNETKQKISEANKGRTYVKNYVWVHDDSKETMIPTENLSDYLDSGFHKGRIYKHDESTKIKIADGQRGVKRSKEFCDKMRQIALNQTPPTDEQKQKHSRFMKEYYQSHDNPFSGKKHSEESKTKMRETLKHKVTINNGTKTIRVMDYNLDKYLDDGWVLGRRT